MKYQIIRLATVVIIMIATTSFQNVLAQSSSAVHKIELNTRIPYYFGLGYEYSLPNNFSARVRAGYLTSPYDKMLYNIIPFDEEFDASIKSFKHGVITELGVAYNYKNNRLAVGVQYAQLVGEVESVTELKPLVEDQIPYIDFILPFISPLLQGKVELQSNIVLMSVGYERVIPFNNPRWEFVAGLTYNKYISSSDVTSKTDNQVVDERYFQVRDLVNKKVEKQFEDYMSFPTIDLAVRYKFKIARKAKDTAN
ncbi:MAG: hypothetical protein HKN22_02490 [Bacteroidia bacterium]|nr:hypothetical protein [Bacteroidia bacterium]